MRTMITIFITIPPTLMEKVDSDMESQGITNRSEYIRSILYDYYREKKEVVK